MRQEVRILVIENGPAVRDRYREALGDDGYQVEQIENFPDAMCRLAEGSFDAVIVDSSMEKATDPELLGRIQREHPGIAVVLASDCSPRRSMTRYIEIGIDDFAIKPFSRDSLRFVVDFALEKMRLKHNAIWGEAVRVDGNGFFY